MRSFARGLSNGVNRDEEAATIPASSTAPTNFLSRVPGLRDPEDDTSLAKKEARLVANSGTAKDVEKYKRKRK